MIKNLLKTSMCVLGVGMSFQVTAYPTDTAEKLFRASDDASSKFRHFYRDIADSVEFFFDDPKHVLTYETRTGRYSGSPLRSIPSAPLCSNSSLSAVVSAYNASASGAPARKAFWTVVSGCVASAEGAEIWLYGKNFNKLDTNRNPKFLYGIFQISTEKNASIELTCVPQWNRHFKNLPSKHGAEEAYLNAHKDLGTLTGLGKGVSSNASSVKSFGHTNHQRLNAFCGVHEVLRANTSSRKTTCLPIFENSGNRYATLRSGSSRLVQCIKDRAPAAMRGEGVFRSFFN